MYFNSDKTHWIRFQETNNQGKKTLVHNGTGDILGHVEPYRGGGVNMKKGYWVTVENCPVNHFIDGVKVKTFNARVKDLDRAEQLIKSMKGLYT